MYAKDGLQAAVDQCNAIMSWCLVPKDSVAQDNTSVARRELPLCSFFPGQIRVFKGITEHAQYCLL